MNRTLLIFGIGLLAGYFIFHKKNISSGSISVGDKSKEIEGMQRLFERVAGIKFNEYGVYDQQTRENLSYLLKDTSVMKGSGSIDFRFTSDLSKIYSNSLTI